MINNTGKEYNLIKKNINNKCKIVGGLTIFSLATLLSTKNISNESVHNHIKYNYYKESFHEATQDAKSMQFDENFLNIYENEYIKIDNKQYNMKEIYIVKCIDNSVHLIKAGENHTDIITGTDIIEKKKTICLFKDSTVFANIYTNGLIDNNNINSSDLIQFMSNWDEKKHTMTLELYVTDQANNAYINKFGR